MVDTRNLKAHETSQDGLPHWPAAVAWWHSRVQLVGPHQERTELLFFPATEETGLHRVHPTWAGTFVLAALVAVFPGINFILLDSLPAYHPFRGSRPMEGRVPCQVSTGIRKGSPTAASTAQKA